MKKILSVSVMLVLLLSVFLVNAEVGSDVIGEPLVDGDKFLWSYLYELQDDSGTSTFTADEGLIISLNENSISIGGKTYVVDSGELISNSIANLKVYEATDYKKENLIVMNMVIAYEAIVLEDKVAADKGQFTETSATQVLTINTKDKTIICKRIFELSSVRISNIPKAFQGIWRSDLGVNLFIGFDTLMVEGQTYQMSPYITSVLTEVSSLFDEGLLKLKAVNIETREVKNIVVSFVDEKLTLQMGELSKDDLSVLGNYSFQREIDDSNFFERAEGPIINNYGDSLIVVKILENRGMTNFQKYSAPTFIDTSTIKAPGNAEEVNLLWDGGEFDFDVPAQVISGRTMVPLRALFEKFGYNISWLAEENTVLAERNDIKIYLPIGSAVMDIYDYNTGENKMIEMDVPAQVVNGRTLVPLRFVSEYVGLKVEWYEESRTVILRGQIN